jgi:hypothetical protein
MLSGGVDDLLAVLGVVVMIEQQTVLLALSVDLLPTREAFFAQILSSATTIWYIHPSYSCSLSLTFLRLARVCRGKLDKIKTTTREKF